MQFVYKQLDTGRTGMLYAWFSVMHTRADVILCHKTEQGAKAIARQIYDELKRLESMGSYFDPSGELYRINETAAIHAVPVSDELYALIDDCLNYREKTQGCFDITIRSDNHSPETWMDVALSPQEKSIFYNRPGVRLDLSGYLKGYALDKIRTILSENQVEDALINLGNSSVLAVGNHPYGDGWKVSFNRDHREVKKKHAHLRNECLTTSGNETEERKHIISPRSGKYVTGMKLVAVVSDSGSEGEALSTSLFVATPTQQKELIATFGVKQVYNF